ncbi:unnamed protein product [Musa acuminata subsp. malaccensis]|uniref:(wild Malaysian banana) hypothetical protein n=1 Tax=Musa acuminata subsp. malaccensis TaxID=214687 RepID=A0A804JXG1_MUSAM|nr:PREDICTED: uncharacterized protein LOC103992138 [Musa acuminata subsp. malaccensis]XP_009410008.1 PREDICTED: uncharacterized protein LOC103992138 [Musa acuminata subsp. malaccensis]XP_009410009.1 PREDICTED: uncharacterized protein LOC103992138 [Musa acuminata subsp. malaccensis]CAG1857134.1 unnamed protein product [Musa acuminata subsp. malaccensis]
MGDHVVLHIDRLTTIRKEGSTSSAEAARGSDRTLSAAPVASSGDKKVEEKDNKVGEEEEPLIQMVDCRICQDEDHIKNLEAPCACSGSLKYAHRACVQHWCNEKGDITCEICHEQYKPGYTAPPQVHPTDAAIDINGGWIITGSPLDLHDPRILAMAAAQRHLVEDEYDEYAPNASGAAFFRSAALILIILLLLRHSLTITNADGDDDDASTYFSLFLLRVAGFLLPCYIMAWAISILQHRRQRQEAAALAATEVAFILQSGRRQGLHLTLAPESPATPQQEPHQQQL